MEWNHCQPTWVKIILPDNPLRDTYDHAFVLLALATAYALDRDAQIRSEIDALLSYLDTHLRAPHGGYAEGFPATRPRNIVPNSNRLAADPEFSDQPLPPK